MSIHQDLEAFLQEWNNDEPTAAVHTSGSTGVPKLLFVEKERMKASARMTCDFLQLQPDDTALLCMPLRFIAGKMMVVRALQRSLKLIVVEPDSRPLKDLQEAPRFAAMVPLQVYETLRNPHDAALFAQIDKVIIGGGAIDPDLEQQLRQLPNRIYSSYGMTETLSHIALRDIHEDGYTPLPGIFLSETEGCLVIHAPALCPEPLRTHDRVVFRADGSFRIIGRSDNVICSGGIKIQIEEVEAALRPIWGNSVQVTSVPHPKFGEEVVYLTTHPIDEQRLAQVLPNKYWLPKHIIRVDHLPLTDTAKPDRATAKRWALVRMEKE